MIVSEDFIFRNWRGELSSEEREIAINSSMITHQDYMNSMIEFAKMHVENCKQEIINNACLYLNPDTNEWEVDLSSIRESYPSSNIK